VLNLARSDRSERYQGSGNQSSQVSKSICWGDENYHRDLSAVKILLIRNVPIDRDRYVEARGLGGGQ
jgi:hypothetical protein